ncbi:MAG: hypothetical protein ACFFD4_32380, partial [Candidatus Odinarchaeota archaeon]
MESVLELADSSENVTISENEFLAIAHATGRDLLKAVQCCAEELAVKMRKPDLLIFFPSSYDPLDKK